MSPDDFRQWLADMQSAGLARSDAACGRLLDVTVNTVQNYKANGTDVKTALACQALLQGLKPYASSDKALD